MPAPIVFFDIAGEDAALLARFYSQVFGWNIAADGRLTAAVVSPLPATIRQDPPEKVLYLGVEDVAAALAEIQANGGSVDLPRTEIPGVVVLALFKDPAGNRMGLVELRDGQPKIP